MENNETIADIIAEMRALSNPISDGIIAISGRSIADRLEAAFKREKATAEKPSAVGDAAKLREALLRCDAIVQLPEVRNEQSIKDMRNIIRQALSAPPRNCDVGTPDEWYERHSKWCANERRKDCAATMCRKCFADFLNKPYQKEGGAS